ncbi:MAG: hypothetical protein R2852_09955, partial [Bacteroidia bacterium]
MIVFFPLLLVIALIVVFNFLRLKFKEKTAFKRPELLLALYISFILLLSFTHSHKIYYFFNLNTILNEESRETNYMAWDKYSWFLYISNKQEEAIDANKKAKSAANKYQLTQRYKEEIPYLE